VNYRDALALITLYAGVFAGIWLIGRREKQRIQREKRTGGLPGRRSPAPPTPASMNPILTATLVVLWAFAPVDRL
jgi:hypothetical protein